MNLSNNKNAVIYARYSSSAQSEQSIEGQLRVINEYAQKEGFNIINTYIDRTMTGRNDDRPDFLRMIKDSENKQFQYVIVYKLDRFSRNRYDSAVHKRTLRNNGVKVISATELILDTPEGIILESMIEGLSEYYSAELAQKVRRGLNESRLKGNFTGGVVIFGYCLKDKKLYINEHEAEIVRKVFIDVCNGRLLKDIADELNNKNIKSSNGYKWNVNKISRLINNEKYIGKATFNGIIYDNIFPAIISEGLFNKTRNCTSTNKRRTKHFRVPEQFILSGKMYCGYCNELMIGESGTSKTKKVYHYYKCRTRKQKLGHCDKVPISKEYIENQVIESIFNFILQPQYIKTLAPMMVKLFNNKIKSDDSVKVFEKLLNKVNKEIDNLLNAIKQGIITTSIKDSLHSLEQEKENLNIKIAKLKSKERTKLTIDQCSDFLYSLVYLDLNILENRKLLIQRFVRKVIIYDDRFKIEFYPIPNADIYVDGGGNINGGNNNSENNVDKNINNSDKTSSSLVTSFGPPIVS